LNPNISRNATYFILFSFRLNHNLEQTAQAIFKSWFIDEPSDDVHTLSEFCSFAKGKKPSIISEVCESGYLSYLTIDALTSNTSSYAPTDKMVTSNASDILMVMDGASSGTLHNGKLGVVGSTFAKVEVVNAQMREVVCQALNFYGDEIRRHNTGSAIPHTDKAFVLSLEIALPTDIHEVAEQFSALRKAVVTNNEESAKLAEIRDSLLPKLMSGELSVDG
jgi:type I restriction enzyme S subunit